VLKNVLCLFHHVLTFQLIFKIREIKPVQSYASAVGFELAIPGFQATEHLRNRITTMIDYHVTFTEQL